MKILTVIGARPQFIKASMVSLAFRSFSTIKEKIIHTGQHFDTNMSEIFFNQLDIPLPDYKLNIHGYSHGQMTGKMLEEIEKVCLYEKPDYLMVYGDTNSTLAGALAASKLHIPIIHIEAGLRSFNMNMPEEINRVLTDQISSILFCPTQTAVNNLIQEGFNKKSVQIYNIGDVMQDSALFFSNKAIKGKDLVNIPNKSFILATLHRAENTDDHRKIISIIEALNYINSNILPVVLPLHPRTQKIITSLGLNLKVRILNPVGYLEMIWLLKHCDLVLTDSGGLQKEAFFFKKPCVTMREETEWIELIEQGVNILAGANAEEIISAVQKMLGKEISDINQVYGGGEASHKIAEALNNNIGALNK